MYVHTYEYVCIFRSQIILVSTCVKIPIYGNNYVVADWTSSCSLLHSPLKKLPFFQTEQNVIAVMGYFSFYPDTLYFLWCFRSCIVCLQLSKLYMPTALKAVFIPTTLVSLLSNILQYLALITLFSKIGNDYFLATNNSENLQSNLIF